MCLSASWASAARGFLFDSSLPCRLLRFSSFSQGRRPVCCNLIRKTVRLRIRLTQAVAVALDSLFYNSLSGARTTAAQGFAENIAIRATLMDAIEKKISTFNLNLNWFDSCIRSAEVILSGDCGMEVGTTIISFNRRSRDDTGRRRSQGIDDQPLAKPSGVRDY